MIQRFLENPFLNTRMSNAKFGLFLLSHNESLSAANTDGKYKDMLDRLKPKSEAFDKWLDKHDKTTINRMGKTQNVNNLITLFSQFVKEEVYKEVSYRFEKNNKEIFNEFFPKGLSEYNNITKKKASVLLDRIEKACLAHKAELPTGLDAKALAFNTEFDQSFSHQLTSKAHVKDASSEGEKLRTEVAQVLYINLLHQLILHADNPKQVLNLYDLTVSGKIKTKKREKAALAMA